MVYDPAPKRYKLLTEDHRMSSIAVSGEMFDTIIDDVVDRKNFDLFDGTFVNPFDGDDIFKLDVLLCVISVYVFMMSC